MVLTGYERQLLESGVFSLPHDLSGNENSLALKLQNDGLVVKQDVKMSGESRYEITDKGRAAIKPQGYYDSGRAYEEKVVLGKKDDVFASLKKDKDE